MKANLIAISAIFLLPSTNTVRAEPLPAGTMQVALEDCQIVSPKSVETTTEIVAGPDEKSKALKVIIGEGEMASWEGKLSFPFSILEPGTYALSFLAKVEPTDATIELSVWKPGSGRSQRISDRRHENVGVEWTELRFAFTVEQPENDLSFSCSGLGRPGTTWLFAAFKLNKQ